MDIAGARGIVDFDIYPILFGSHVGVKSSSIAVANDGTTWKGPYFFVHDKEPHAYLPVARNTWQVDAHLDGAGGQTYLTWWSRER